MSAATQSKIIPTLRGGALLPARRVSSPGLSSPSEAKSGTGSLAEYKRSLQINQQTFGAMARPRGAPMTTIRGAMSLLDLGEDQLLSLLQEGSLLWSWNIALKPERSCLEIRILPEALEEFRKGKECYLGWPQVLRLLLPSDGQTISLTLIARLLNCSSTHVHSLIRAKLLHATTKHRRGPGGAPQVSTQSLIDFLKSRRYAG